MLNVFKPDDDFQTNEKNYEDIKREILGESSSEDEDGSSSSDSDSSSGNLILKKSVENFIFRLLRNRFHFKYPKRFGW